MAKQTKPAGTAANENVDDLLGTSNEGTSNETGAAEGTEKSGDSAEAVAETPEQKKIRIEAEVKAMQETIKKLKAEAKGEKPKAERVLKGHMVTFRNKAGEQVTGLGTLYYVTRMNGKLFYKEASQVAILPEGWKEGDALPTLPGEEAAKA